MNQNIFNIINKENNIKLWIKEIVDYIETEFWIIEMEEKIERFDYPEYGILKFTFNDFLEIQFNTKVHWNSKNKYWYLESCFIVNYKDGLCEIIYHSYIKILKENKEGIFNSIKELYI